MFPAIDNMIDVSCYYRSPHTLYSWLHYRRLRRYPVPVDSSLGRNLVTYFIFKLQAPCINEMIIAKTNQAF